MKFIFISYFLFLTFLSSAITFQAKPELEKIFQEEKAKGTFALLDPAKQIIYVANLKRAQTRFIPASTFKIANTLIGLDAKVIKNVDEVLPYGGKPQPFKEWEHDMGLREAIRISNVPIYQELARRIGSKRMAAGVKTLNYGNQTIGSVVDRFWLDGPLTISAIEQIEFLHKLTQNQLPVDAKAIAAVKEITLQEKTKTYQLHAKTGWGTSSQPQIGWWVGWIERDNQNYPFALNMDILKKEDVAKRIVIGKKCLEKLKLIKN